MKRLFTILCMALFSLSAIAQETETYSGNIIDEESAWCWFADPRAIHYENEAGTINASYIGFIDVHGNIKAAQYDWTTGHKSEVLIRSYFSPTTTTILRSSYCQTSVFSSYTVDTPTKLHSIIASQNNQETSQTSVRRKGWQLPTTLPILHHSS